MAAGSLPIARTPAGGKYIDFSKFQVIDQPLWDTLDLSGTAALATQQTLFQTPLGQAGKTIIDTNMEQAGSLGAPKNQLVTGISVVSNPDTPKNELDDLLNKATFTFQIADKKNFVLPVHMLGKSMESGFAGATAGLFVGIGAPGVRQGYKLRYPFVIPSQQPFQVFIDFGTALGTVSNLKLWVYLHGIQTRSIK